MNCSTDLDIIIIIKKKHSYGSLSLIQVLLHTVNKLGGTFLNASDRFRMPLNSKRHKYILFCAPPQVNAATKEVGRQSSNSTPPSPPRGQKFKRGHFLSSERELELANLMRMEISPARLLLATQEARREQQQQQPIRSDSKRPNTLQLD